MRIREKIKIGVLYTIDNSPSREAGMIFTKYIYIKFVRSKDSVHSLRSFTSESFGDLDEFPVENFPISGRIWFEIKILTNYRIFISH